MTKVQVHFELLRPLDETLMQRVADAHALYGIQRVQAPTLDHLVVDYDASRLNREQVESALHRAGIPVRPRS